MGDWWRRVAGLLVVAIVATAYAAGCGGGAGGPTGGAGSGSTGSAGAGAAGRAGTTGSAGVTGGAGSGGGARDGGAADGPSTTVDDPTFAPFCAAVRQEMINFYDRCQGLSPDVGKAFVTRDPCVWWGAAVNGNRMAFDGTQADACIAALKAVPCDADQTPPICDRALTGLQQVGDTCSKAAEMLLFSECEAGDACMVDQDGCEGKCVARATLTKPCGFGMPPCLEGESCGVLGTSTCVTKAGLGEPCGVAATGCLPGFYCTDLFNGGTCQTRGGMGAPCGPTQDACAPPLTCDTKGSINGGTCQMAARPGTTCDSTDLLDTTCTTGFLSCGDDMKCHPWVGLGESCAGDVICAAGLCDTSAVNPVCKGRPAGTNCTVDRDCAANALCASVNLHVACTDVCVPR